MTAAVQIAALTRRALNEVIRVPGAAIPAVIAPTVFVLGVTAVFGKLSALPGFTTGSYITFLLGVGMLQAAGFSGAATGVNLARDIEFGWTDRLLASPTPRWVLLAGIVASGCLRSLMPISFLLCAGFALGAEFPGIDGLLVAVALAVLYTAIVASFTSAIALKVKTQTAGPLMQAGSLIAVFFTTSYAPDRLLADWFRDIADANPVTDILGGIRQGFVADVTWADTWPALLAGALLLSVGVALALRGMRRIGV